MKAKETWTIGIASEYRITGFNPENADMDNPRGERVELVYFLVAENARGERRIDARGFMTEGAADRYVPAAPPVFLWSDWHPAYGSPAYEEAEPEIVEAEKRDALDAEFFGRYR